MITLTCPRPTVKPSRFALVEMFLRDRGYDTHTIEAAGSDPSLVSPADAASVARIVGHPAAVEVKGLPYAIEPLHSPDGPAYRLTSPRGTVYDIEDTCHGATCDCPDWTLRRAGLDAGGCKHIRALVREGLIANAHTPSEGVVTVATPVEAPAAVEPLTEAEEADRAIADDRACFLPVTEEGKRTAREISARQVRLERIAAELEALRSAPLDPVVPVEARHADETEPGNDGASTADVWPAWTDDFRWELGAGEDDDEGGSEFEGWASAPPSPADPAAVAAAFVTAWLADLADPRSHLYAAKLPARPSADERPVRLRTPRRTNVGSQYSDFDQLISKGCV